MSFTSDQWVEIADFPVCPVKALEEVLVGKEIQEEDLEKVDLLVSNLVKHERELRELRQEIERRMRAVKMDLLLDSEE